MSNDLGQLYIDCNCGHCHDHDLVAQFTMVDEQWANDLAKQLALEAQRIWKLKGMPKKINKAITEAYALKFMAGVQEGFGVNSSEIDYNTPDGEMLNNLTQNVYAFSAAKNYTQMRQLTQALLDDQGKLRTWSQFKKQAFAINEAHTVTWLKTEYDTSIASAQMARKWVDIQSQKDSLGLLQFDAIIDTRTSDTCRPLDGVIKPVDDPFWNVYYPPNHFRCRSMVKQLRSGKVTPNHEVTHPEKGIPDMFKTNLAKTGMIFPPAHPYWEGIPEDVYQETIKLYPYDLQFDYVDKQLYNGRLRVHKLLKKGSDYGLHLQIGAEKASIGSFVDILPIIPEKEESWRSIIFHDGFRNKNADLRIDNILVEVKEPLPILHINKLSHSISQASTQASIAIINLYNDFDKVELQNLANGKFMNHKNLKEIQFRIKGKYLKFRK